VEDQDTLALGYSTRSDAEDELRFATSHSSMGPLRVAVVGNSEQCTEKE
jgi:hypothetical protein